MHHQYVSTWATVRLRKGAAPIADRSHGLTRGARRRGSSDGGAAAGVEERRGHGESRGGREMDGAKLRALEHSVRPVALTGALTLEQAASAIRLNREIARFHAALAQVRRMIQLAGVVDTRLREELLARAAQLVKAREALASELTRHGEPHARA
jgi:hypothetical protein